MYIYAYSTTNLPGTWGPQLWKSLKLKVTANFVYTTDRDICIHTTIWGEISKGIYTSLSYATDAFQHACNSYYNLHL